MRRLALLLILAASTTASAEDWKAKRDADLQGMPRDARAEVICRRDGDFSVAENLAAAKEKVPGRYNAWLRGGATVSTGTVADTVGFGYGAVAEASVGLLHPFYLGGGVRWMPSMGPSSSVQLDAVAGIALRSFGTKWIKAGANAVGGAVLSWSGNCQVRRTDYVLVGGGKYLRLAGAPEQAGLGTVETTQVMAAQVGIQQIQRRNARSRQGGWNLSALYDPFNQGWGMQAGFSGQGLLVFIPGPDFVYTGMSAGILLSPNYATTPIWATLDLGVAFEL